MKLQNITFKIALLLFFATPICTLIGSEKKSEDPLPQANFHWAFCKKGELGKIEVLPAKRKLTLSSGDSFRVYLKTEKDLYVYLYLHDISEKLHLLWPNSKANSAVLQGEKTLPSTDSWYELDNKKGTETFYLLTSEKPLENLEKLIAAYSKKPEANSQEALIAEIKSLKKSRSSLIGEGSKSIAIAGSIRSVGKKTLEGAHAVQVRKFYAKTIKIIHE